MKNINLATRKFKKIIFSIRKLRRAFCLLGVLVFCASSTIASNFCPIGMPTIPGDYIPLSAYAQYIYYVAEYNGVEKIVRKQLWDDEPEIVWDNTTDAYYDWANDCLCSQQFPGIRIGRLDVSPDGETLAFGIGLPQTDAVNGAGEPCGGCNYSEASSIFLLDLTTTESNEIELLGLGSAPNWSPDGTKLAYHKETDGRWEIYVMDMATRTAEQLTYPPHPEIDDSVSYSAFPSWSPDGNSIAFVSKERARIDYGEGSCPPHDIQGGEAYYTQLFVMDTTGDNLRQFSCQTVVTEDGGYPMWHDDNWPTWSPGGNEIAFSRFSEDEDLESCTEDPPSLDGEPCGWWYNRLLKVDLETLETARVTGSLGRIYFESERFPSWSKDGNFLAITVPNGEGNYDIWLVHPESGEYLENITINNPGRDLYPVFGK